MGVPLVIRVVWPSRLLFELSLFGCVFASLLLILPLVSLIACLYCFEEVPKAPVDFLRWAWGLTIAAMCMAICNFFAVKWR